MFRFSFVKNKNFNPVLHDYCLKLTNDSIKKKIENELEIKKKNFNLNNSLIQSSPSPDKNNPLIIVTCIGLFFFSNLLYFFLNQKKKFN